MSNVDLFSDRRFRKPDDSLGFLLWRVTHSWQRYVDEQLQAFGLTHLQFALMVALGWLTRSGDVVTQSDLVEFVEMHPMQVSQVLSILERKGQIARERHPANGRTKIIALTEPGAVALREALPVIEAAHDGFFGREGGTTADLRTMLGQLVALRSR